MTAPPRHQAPGKPLGNPTAPTGRHRATLSAHLALGAALAATLPAHAASSCASDGQRQPLALYERFLSADCEACWTQAPERVPGPTTLVVDWIVPSARGDEAALSAVATRDALERLQDLGRAPPLRSDTHVTAVEPLSSTPPGRSALRVAHGLVFNDHVGTGIQWRPAAASARRVEGAAPYRFTLLLAEAVTAGTEGSPVARNLVRNMLQGTWSVDPSLPKVERTAWMENRPMRVPEGVQAERLRVLGWLTDAQGRVVAAAQSVCR